MKNKSVLFFCYCIFLLSSCKSTGYKDKKTVKDQLIFTLEKVTDSLYAPLALENAHDGSQRIFIAEQAGRIMILKNGRLLKEPFLNIRSLLVPMKNEYMDVGILGFAFHPDYKNNGRFFVHYSAPSKKGFDNTSVLAEFKVSANNPDRADPQGKVILEVDQPQSNHNGGNIVFDKKGYLYIGFGDGGGQGDAHGNPGNGQNLNQLLGKIIRIDVDHKSPYSIPADNPFVGKEGRDEIWSYGMRMPWRISFDEKTGKLFCGDVGQDTYEEVDIIEKGKNYGWRAMEGFHPYDSILYEKGGNFALPITEYPHKEGVSIIGGYVYRGEKFPLLQGKYIFGDWAFKVFYLEQNSKQQWIKHDCKFEGKDDNKFDFRINSFGTDESGEIYMVTQNEIGAINRSGVVYKIKLANSEKE
ncbi:PQQ-dependent sugar dehydrogenase [Segetibacter koreensis]|uniref:PQQ-dependent sugar dehydrogenase n=1 Tax=Segetibacter koreensis TaxID=398037 RepID=UPI00037E8739|nr:PQQ-dependent sugar dehydrogenase [Segetibacter koreensis]